MIQCLVSFQGVFDLSDEYDSEQSRIGLEVIAFELDLAFGAIVFSVHMKLV